MTNDNLAIKHAHFQINAALFEELGERLVSRPEIALAELIKNSYDADASVCDVHIAHQTITVADDGHGLTEQQFLSNWMVVSSTHKSKHRYSRYYKRPMAGSKGVGRFSARFLGNKLGLETVAASDAGVYRLRATFDWTKIGGAVDVNEITIDYTVEKVSARTPTGTTLTISRLREHVRDMPHDRVRSDVLKLVNADAGLERPSFKTSAPKGDRDPGFQVRITGSGVASASDGDLATSILAAYVARARVAVDEKGRVDFRLYWKDRADPIEVRTLQLGQLARPYTAKALAKVGGSLDDRGLPKAVEDIVQLPVAVAVNSPVFMDIRFFPGRKGTFAGLPTNGREAQRWVKEHAGLAIVDNGFAMPSYADDNSDWLDIEASKARNERHWQSVITPSIYPMDAAARSDTQRNPMLALPRMSQLIGRIHIATKKPPNDADVDEDAWLQPNMDREQLRDNGAYRLLWHLTRFTVEAIAHFDRKLRLEADEKAEKQARQETRASLAAAIQQVKTSKELTPDHKASMLQQLREVEQNIATSESYDRASRVSLELMSMMGVMAGFMTHEFDKALDALRGAGAELRKLAKHHPALRPNVEKVLANEQLLSEQADYMRLFVGWSRKGTIVPFKAKAQLKVATGTVAALAHDHDIVVDIDVDARLAGPAVPLAAYHGVVINLVSNAMKALVGRSGHHERLIRLYATNENNRHVLVCADNGVGVPEFLRDRIWDPLFTTTQGNDERNPLNSGLGLGLSVVKRVVEAVGGRIELMKTPPLGFATAFRVFLPLPANGDS